MSKKPAQVFSFFVDEDGAIPEMYLYGFIGEDWWSDQANQNTATKLVQEFKRLEKSHDIIKIKINSEGGSMYHGLPFLNAIIDSEKEIHTYNDGLVASMAFDIFAAGDYRHWGTSATGMSHQGSTVTWGNIADHENSIEMLKTYNDAAVQGMVASLNMTEDEVTAEFMQEKDRWFTRKQAEEIGLINGEDEFESTNTESKTGMTVAEMRGYSNRVAAMLTDKRIPHKNKKSLEGNYTKNISKENTSEMIEKILSIFSEKLGTEITHDESNEQATIDSITSAIDAIVSERDALIVERDDLQSQVDSHSPGDDADDTGESTDDSVNSNLEVQSQLLKMKKRFDKLEKENKAQAKMINQFLTDEDNPPKQDQNNSYGNIQQTASAFDKSKDDSELVE